MLTSRAHLKTKRKAGRQGEGRERRCAKRTCDAIEPLADSRRLPHGQFRIESRCVETRLEFETETDLDLDRLKTGLDMAGAFLGIVGYPIDAIALERSGRIGAYLLTQTAAKQNGNGYSEMLAFDIPEGDIDSGKGGYR